MRSPTSSDQDHGVNDNHGESSSDESSDVLDPGLQESQPKKRKRLCIDEDIADQLVLQITFGMQKMEKRKESFDPFMIHDSHVQKQTSVIQAVDSKINEIRAVRPQCQHILPENVDKLLGSWRSSRSSLTRKNRKGKRDKKK